MSKDDEISRVQGTSINKMIQRAQQAEKLERMLFRQARQVTSESRLEAWAERGVLFTPYQLHKGFKKIEDKIRAEPPSQKGRGRGISEAQKISGEASIAERIAAEFYERNPELQKKTLLLLQTQITAEDSHDIILQTIQRIYMDHALVDEAIDYLIEVAMRNQALRMKLIETKERFNIDFGREIRAGRNIASQARQFSEMGLGSPTALRDLYREVTHNPRTPHLLFEELSEKFEFSQIKDAIDFILHSLGADMKAKGPSIGKAELQRLFSEARDMQAILGVFRFFLARMKMIKGQFNRLELTIPAQIHFETLARLFMHLIQERYPSSNQVLQLAFTLGISEEVAAQIIIFTQYRDALRQVSPRLFKSEKQRQDFLTTLMETLQDLEDELEEEPSNPEE